MRLEERPFRGELFSIELLQRHARELAHRHQLGVGTGRNGLLSRLTSNERLLREYNEQTLEVEKIRCVTPAAEWISDNFYLIEEQIRMARRHLPRQFNRELPHLLKGPNAHFPRVYELALELISHVDGRIDAEHLKQFIAAYQEVSPLKIGELWAIAIMLRLGLIENLRRVAALLAKERHDRDNADLWAGRLVEIAEKEPQQVIVAVARLAQADLEMTSAFVAQFWSRLHRKSPALKLVLNWMKERLAEDHLTIEQLVQTENQNQAADQVSVGNSISSLRYLDSMDWREFVESLSVVERTLRDDPAGFYRLMDFATRDAYRHGVERVARYSGRAEKEVAEKVVELARGAMGGQERRRHVGYFLLDEGLEELERVTGFRAPLRIRVERLFQKRPLFFYLGGIGLVTVVGCIGFLVLAEEGGVRWGGWGLGLTLWLALISVSQLAVALVNWFATLVVAPRLLPRMDFSEGIPSESRTMVVVPTVLTSVEGVESLLEALEVRFLGNKDPNVVFALLTDFRDLDREHGEGDEELVTQALEGVRSLNMRYGEEGKTLFYLFHRPRLWNEREQVWMGYERKRGKLGDLNRLLRGGGRECFSHVEGDLEGLSRIQYVLTLDTDTLLPRDAVRQLAGAMAHPLNRPQYDEQVGRVVEGYGILQPRVAIGLSGANRSRFARLFSGEPGIDPYTRSVSDVYQDLFQEGSFIGKGIYDVDAFERAVGGKFPKNRILSHDLLEGSYARAGLVSDVQLFEEFPSAYTADTRRRHRWMRGDWQIATWLLPRVPGAEADRVKNPIAGLSRWKIFDNLRRSLVPAGLLGLLVWGWLGVSESVGWWTMSVMLVVFLPGVCALWATLWGKPRELPWPLHLQNLGLEALRQGGQGVMTMVFLPFDAWIGVDAVLRTMARLLWTGRHLLEWQTAAEVEKRSRSGWRGYFRTMCQAPVFAAVLGLVYGAISEVIWTPVYLFVVCWAVSPLVAWWISEPLEEKETPLDVEQQRVLRRLARKTWRYFETFMGAEENHLPADNYQEEPRPMIASRTSPTNMGMGLVATLGAWDLGYLSVPQLLNRLEATLGSMERLERYRGHFYNWYDTRSLVALQPLYISTVDSGNLAGLLLTLRSGLLELRDRPWGRERMAKGLLDSLDLWMETLEGCEGAAAVTALHDLESLHEDLSEGGWRSPGECVARLQEVLRTGDKMPEGLAGEQSEEYVWWKKSTLDQARGHLEDLWSVFPWLRAGSSESGWAWPESMEALRLRKEEVREARGRVSMGEADGERRSDAVRMEEAWKAGWEEGSRRVEQLDRLIAICDRLALMDFDLLYDSRRKLFSIGYNVTHHRLDGSYYDLLASEARLTSFVTIAQGQVPQEHWFALGRLLTSVHGRQALISWSGSMFEYLMPPLVMPSYGQTLLDVSCRAAVVRQMEYGRQRGIPWGISESGYHLTDAQSHYQYRAFGVPGLGFKRGLAEDLVVAPYATVMALLYAPGEAYANLERLREEGGSGRYGYYEALDYTPSRVARGQTHAVLRSFMAHHQGMSLLALVHVLEEKPMQRRFQAHPLFRAAELLLQERVPRKTAVLYPHEMEANRTRVMSPEGRPTFRAYGLPLVGAPEVQLLSNGRYHVMVTHSGGGYSEWNDTALTRWREDATRDCWGTFVYLRDLDSGKMWSAAHQPVRHAGMKYEAIFSQSRAEFRTRLEDVVTHMEISVSPEDDVEVRRLAITNHSSEDCVLEVTSFCEVALHSAAADESHPAFSKLFVQSEILEEFSALLFSRRPRARGEQPPWMFQLMLSDGEETEQVSFETDRGRFVGRCRQLSNPGAMDGAGLLSNTDGAVLDPAGVLRRVVKVGAKKSVRVTLIMGAASNRDSLMKLVTKYQDLSIADRVFELAWTHGMVTLRHLNATEPQAQLFARLAGALLYQHPRYRAAGTILAHNHRGQSHLWSYGISGDLPIILVRTTQMEGVELVRELIQAHAYWRFKGLAVDLVILNDDNSVYRQSIHDQIMSFIVSGTEGHLLDKPGGLFVRRAELMSHEDQILLQSVARVVLSDDDGNLSDQLMRHVRADLYPPALVPTRDRGLSTGAAVGMRDDLIFFNGWGGFTPDGREYVMLLKPEQVTPAPWVNVLANPQFGTLVSESGGGYTWSENCHEFRLTPWTNDPVTDDRGEAVYIRDEVSGRFWSPTPLPAGGRAGFTVRHGLGYSVFETVEAGIASELWIYVDVEAPVKFVRLIMRNQTRQERVLSVTGYWEWVLGDLRSKNMMHVVTEIDHRTGAMWARNSYNTDFGDRVAFVASSDFVRSSTADRMEFLGSCGTLANPAAMGRVRLSGKVGTGMDPCAAMQVPVTLGPGEEHEVIFKLGAAMTRDRAYELLQQFRGKEACRDALARVHDYWNRTLGAVFVETQDASVNVMANGWLMYQTMAGRMWARTGFYQSGGAYGFRDQLQDAMALVHCRPELLREHLLRAAAHQFLEGDVQHWWHPPKGRGVRTHFSDDYLWLPYATCRYVEALGDTGVLSEMIPYMEGRVLRPEEEAYYDLPRVSEQSGTLYEHCVRAIRHGLRFGERGLPLMGCGDWNDGMNLIGEHGRGESVWLAFFLHEVLTSFAVVARGRGDERFALECLEHGRTLRENIEKEAWDGAWYRRAFFDNGEPVGSAKSEECQIDALPQSWAVLSGVGDEQRVRMAMEAVSQRLVRREARLIQLFDPPFDHSNANPGYIKGYLPGVRENGGQYTHGAIWTVMAFAAMGDSRRAWECFEMINPVNHARTRGEAARYVVEPYVVAADVYSVSPHVGRGGWTWYTGSAGWMYRLVLESLLGVRLEVDRLRFKPCLPKAWSRVVIHYTYRETTHRITMLRRGADWGRIFKIVLDGREMLEDSLVLQVDRNEHRVEVHFGGENMGEGQDVGDESVEGSRANERAVK